MKKTLDSLFELNDAGSITRLRGEKIESASHLIRVLAEHGESAPPKETDWVLKGAYSFARRIGCKSSR